MRIIPMYEHEVLADFFINLAATYIAAIFVVPGIFGIHSFQDILLPLTINLPLGIVTLRIAVYLKRIVYEHHNN